MFKDVYKKAWYYKSIQNVVKYGLMVGRDKEHFAPNEGVTRAELAVTMDRLYQLVISGFANIIDKVLPAVVEINSDGNIGSGTIIHSQGYILTNAHFINHSKNLYVLSKEMKFRNNKDNIIGQLIAIDNFTDLAIIKITADQLPTLKMSNNVKQGEEVMAVGSPLGYTSSTTQGIVSGFPIQKTLKYIQTDTEINFGNSGGALVNLRGELIAVPSYKFEGFEGMGFCLSVDEIRKFIHEYVSQGKLPDFLLKL